MRLSNFTQEELSAYLRNKGSDKDRQAYKEGKAPVILCRRCGAKMKYKPQGKARSYCSNKCRQAAYRSRKNDPAD